MNSPCWCRFAIIHLFAGIWLTRPADGLVAGEIYQLSYSVANVIIQPDQKILVAGHGGHIYCLDEATSTIRRRPGSLFRLHPDGSIDESFNHLMSGIAYLQLAPDGRLFVKGPGNDSKRSSPGDFAFLRPDGSFDDSFRAFRNLSNGVPRMPFSWWPHASLHPVALEKSGQIAIPPLNDPVLPTGPFTRLDASGQLLPIPSGDFPRSLRWGRGLAARNIRDLSAVAREVFATVPVELCRWAIQLPDGRLMMLVAIEGVTQLRRFESDWRLDESFVCTLEFSTNPTADVSIAQQPDGRLVVGGNFTKVNGLPSTGLIRLHQDGSVDDSFSCSLTVHKAWHGTKVALQKDGRIVIGGFFEQVNGVNCRYLARLNPDGSLDRKFQSRFVGDMNNIAAKFYAVSLGKGHTTTASLDSNARAPSPQIIWIKSLNIDSPGVAVIRFQAQPRQSYILQAKDLLGEGAWSNVTTNSTDKAGQGVFHDKTTTIVPSRFYRIAVP